MRISLPYGHKAVEAELDWAGALDTLDIADVPEITNRDAAIREALENPIGLESGSHGGRGLFGLAAPGERIVILVSDWARHTAVDQVLPVMLDGLAEAGVSEGDITLLFATGTHRPPTEAEQARILGSAIYERFAGRCVVHDPRDEANLVRVGTTSRGTPVSINRIAHEADRLIATGGVVLHYFGGFGGGRKSVIPGIAALETIARNHAMNLDPHEDRLNPQVRIGVLDGNPVAEDMLEGAKLTHVDFVVNTVLNREGRIAGIFAGELDAAHREAAEFARTLYTVSIDHKADVVIASSGAAKNFVQSHKSLYNAYQAVKPEGRIVLLTECAEGLGGEQFEQWLRLGHPQAIIAELRKQAEINGQTALSTVAKSPITTFVTSLSEKDVECLGGRKASSLVEALDGLQREWAGREGPGPSVYVMPSASYTVPVLREG